MLRPNASIRTRGIAGNLRARQGKLRSIQKALREKAF